MGIACSTNGEQKDAHRLLVGKPEVKKSLGRPRHTLLDNFQLVLGEIVSSGMDWIGLT
jgi:hypothetical protein